MVHVGFHFAVYFGPPILRLRPPFLQTARTAPKPGKWRSPSIGNRAATVARRFLIRQPCLRESAPARSAIVGEILIETGYCHATSK